MSFVQNNKVPQMHNITAVKSNKQIKYNCYKIVLNSNAVHVQLFYKWENWYNDHLMKHMDGILF